MPVMMPPTDTADHHRPVAVRVIPAEPAGSVRTPSADPARAVPAATGASPPGGAGAPRDVYAAEAAAAGAAATDASIVEPAERACAAGIAAAWTGHCDGTVDLTRLAGPRNRALTVSDVGFLNLPGSPPWPLARTDVRCALYEWALMEGTQFDIYRWVNLVDLADVWAALHLSDGVRAEWERVLLAAELLPPD